MIDMTKQYKTRDGRNVRILCVDGPDRIYPVIGLIDGNLLASTWSSQGQYSAENKKQELDLIVVKPKLVVERWVNIFQYKNDSRNERHIDWFDDSQSALAAHYNPNITVLTRAVPFKWEGEG